ncbi:MAG TPA: hypothetical protein P5511_09195, partial [Candidatus Goldiibacteriota bacterium]|nr:hypothetical protein [Candidatus Goldiibacteriota bacterium]
MLKTALQYANESNGAITITADAKSMTMLIKGGTQADLLSALTMAVTSGSMTSEQAEKAFSLIESGKLAGNGGNMSITKDNAGIKFTIQGMPEMIETIALQAKGEAAGAMKSILYSIMESKVFTQNIIEMLPDISKAAAVQVRELNAALKNNVISPQNTDINSNIRQSAALLNAMHNSLENLVRQLQTTDKNFVVTRTNQGFLENFKAGISAVLSRTTRIISESGMKNGPENIHIKPADFQALRSSVMALTAETEKVFDSTPDKSMTFVSGTHTQVKPSAGQQISDIESAIEAIVFLKSRNLPDTPAITGIMARYFKNDLKIGQTLEALNVSLARVEKSLSGDKGAARLLEAINGFKQAAANSYIKAGNRENSTAFMEQQLKAYI